MKTRAPHGMEAGTACERVIYAVCEESGTRPTELPPLYDAVDPDALDAIVSHGRGSPRISFRYYSYTVIVEPDRVTVSAASVDDGESRAPGTKA